MQVTIKERQWLGDVALETGGSVEALFLLALANDLSITDDLTAGGVLDYNDILDTEIVSYYTVNEIFPATAIVVSDDIHGGIGYMQIGTDFKVS